MEATLERIAAKPHDWRSADETHGFCVDCGMRWYDGDPEPAAPCTSKTIGDYTDLSAFIKAAVAEASSLDRDFYSPNANNWHVPASFAALDHFKQGCVVCFAGAMLANMLPSSITVTDLQNIRSFQLGESAIARLGALDAIRCGDLVSAYTSFVNANVEQPTESQRAKLIGLQAQIDGGLIPIDHPEFVGWEQFDAFLTSMTRIADKLEAAGL